MKRLAIGTTGDQAVADALNIVLYPLQPTDGGDFQSTYLQGLKISAYEVDMPHPIPAAGAQPGANLIGTATYDSAKTSTSANGILQHEVQTGIVDVAAAVASAVIFLGGAIDAGQPYVNIVLQIERNTAAITDRSINYDAPVVALPTPLNGTLLDTFTGSGSAVPCFDLANSPPTLYVGLAPAAGALASIDLPADGSPPPFADLRKAVTKVLATDPAIIDPAAPAPDLAALTPQQCTHIAREILWLRTSINPVPLSQRATNDNVPLEQLYTGAPVSPPNPPASFSGDDKDREEFQGSLQSYYATLDAKTSRLAQYIFALSAALNCSQQASAATTAELIFPVRASGAAVAGQIAEAAVRLQG